jgi:hypothetical protein
MSKFLRRVLRNLIREIHALAWTLGGTGMVLITLSGKTREWGIWISVASLAVHLAGVLFKKDE